MTDPHSAMRADRPTTSDLRSALGALPDPLSIVAEDLLGLDARIDWIAQDPFPKVSSGCCNKNPGPRIGRKTVPRA